MAAKNTETVKRATPRQGEPKYDPKRSAEDNVYAMRNAGLTWPRVEALCGLDYRTGTDARRFYRKACEERGEQPKDFRRKENRAPATTTTKKPATKRPARKATKATDETGA